MTPNKNYLLSLLSGNDVTFFIPPYQRNYEWDDSQCDVFFKDVARVAKQNASGVRAEHFIGMLVYVQEKVSFGQPAKLVLVDGQQRITTTMLFLMAMRDEIDDPQVKSFIDSRYLKNNNVIGNDEHKVKLKQVETDWPAYLKLVMGDTLSSEEEQTRVAKNYRRFRKSISSFKKANQIALPALIEIGLGKFSVVTIQLEPELNPWENPQEVFESMNSLGKPLSLADLVRNWLLMGKPADEQEKLYHTWWLPMERDLGASGQVSNFIRDYMQLVACTPFKKATSTNHKELYSQFKKLFENDDATTLLPTMERYAKLYAPIVLPERTCGSNKIDRRLADIRTIGATTAYSFVLALMESWNAGRMTEIELDDSLGALLNYLLRRRIIRLTQGENKSFPELTERVLDIETAPDARYETFRILAGQGYALRLPTNAEVIDVLRSMNFYSFAQAKYLLALVEESLTKSRPHLEDMNLQLERIMPRALNDDWYEELGEDAEEVHGNLLDTIGNVTLIRHSQELGNIPFKAKKGIYADQAGMQVSRTEITNRVRWDKESIDNRAAWIVKHIATIVLAIPAEFNKVAATATSRSRSGRISLAELGLVGRTIEFMDDPSYKALVITDSVVEFEGKRWRLSPLTSELKNRLGKANPSGKYRGAAFWAYNGTRILDMQPIPLRD